MRKRAYPLERSTSLRIGGPADHLVVPESEEELQLALVEAFHEGMPVRALGGGKNLLVDDRGVLGTVVSFARLKGIRRSGNLVVAGAGTSIAALLGRTVSMGLSGLEGLSGVPGSVGGAVRMNAGGAGGSIGDRVVWVRGFTRSGTSFRFGRDACGFGYRTSRMAGTFVTEVALALEPGPPDLRSRVKEIFARKRAAQPLFAATAGCMFKNPSLPGGESAGWLLDRVGLKGFVTGAARFSTLHANFVENAGGASFEDVARLIEEGRRRVFDSFGVRLTLEVEVWQRDGREALPRN